MSDSVRGIDSNQTGIHDKLHQLVTRYLNTENKRPIQPHTEQAFLQASQWLGEYSGEIILDSCCGVGESTAKLAARFPNTRVIGIDKSAHRLAKHSHYSQFADNYLVLRADLNDFWRLVVKAHWPVSHHYILYPNPYPKSSQVQKRWHASAAFADIIQVGGRLEVRSNWQLYIDEFTQALHIAGKRPKATCYDADEPMTPFERKYWSSGQSSWQVVCDL